MNSRVIGGTIIDSRDQYKWFCTVINSATHEHTASAVYIGGKYVLTSANRLLTSSDSDGSLYGLLLVGSSDISVRIGQLSQSDTSLIPRIYNVAEIIPHPDFRYDLVEQRDASDMFVSVFSMYANDLAILKLTESPHAEAFLPIELLPSDMVSDVIMSGTELTVVGQGQRNLTLSDGDFYTMNLSEQTIVPTVPVEITSDTIYTTDSNVIREVTLTIVDPSDSLWDNRMKVHASVFKTYGQSDLGFYVYDSSKDTNSDSASAIANVRNLLATDWGTYWVSALQSTYGFSLMTATNYVTNVRDTLSQTDVASDFCLSLKITAGTEGHGLASGDEGAPAVYHASDGTYYLVGIYNTGPRPTITGLNYAESMFPELFSNIDSYRSWIAGVTADIELSDREITNAQGEINQTTETIVSSFAEWSANVSDQRYTSDNVELWQQTTSDFAAETSDLATSFGIWSSDIVELLNTLDLFSSDGSILYTLCSDLSANIGPYTSDNALVASHIPTLTTAQFPSDTQLFALTATSLQSDVKELYSSLGSLNYDIAAVSSANAPTTYRDAFYRLRVSNPFVLFDTNSLYDPDDDAGNNHFFTTKTIGDAEILFSTDAYFALTVTNSGDIAIRQTRHYVPDQLGKSKMVLLGGVLLPGTQGQSSIVSKMGMFDSTDGYYVRLDADGIHVCELRGGIELRVPQSGWNIDSLDGSGSSGINMSSYVVSNGGVPHVADLRYTHLLVVIDTQWSGLTRVGFFIGGIPRYVHQFGHEHLAKPPMPGSQLPIRYQIEKVNSASDGIVNEMRMSWCSVLLEGTFVPYLQKFSLTNARSDETIVTPSGVGVEAALTPLFSLKLNPAFTKATIKITGIKLKVSTDNDIYWELIKNATLDDDTWLEEVPRGSTAMIDKDASRYARGVVIKEGFVTYSNIYSEKLVETSVDYLVEPNVGADIDGNPETVTFGVRNLRGHNPIKIWYIINWVELF